MQANVGDVVASVKGNKDKDRAPGAACLNTCVLRMLTCHVALARCTYKQHELPYVIQYVLPWLRLIQHPVPSCLVLTACLLHDLICAALRCAAAVRQWGRGWRPHSCNV